MATTLPSEFRLIPARAGLNAVSYPSRRNIQAGTAILNLKRSFELMLKVFIVIAIVSLSLFFTACGSSENTNTNANANIGAGAVNVDPNNLPPGLSTSPVPISGNSTPGIPDPANANNVPKGGTPTPGIPDPAEMKKPFKPGATPTPGIPSPEEIRRQMQIQRNVNVNVQPPTGSDTMMKSRKQQPVNRP